MYSENRRRRSSPEVLKDVVFALFFRELKTRFGPWRLGLTWAFLEPISFVLVLSAIRSLVSSGSLFGGENNSIPYPVFFLLGFVPYQLFFKLLVQSAQSINANQGLFNYRQVRPIDAIIARALLEVLVIGCVILLFMAGFWWFGFELRIDSPLQFITVFLLLALFSVGIGMVVCVGQLRFPELEKIIPIITRPLFFISGVFFSLNDIPDKYHYLLTWNPLLHAIELIRNGCYKGYNSDGVSIYVLALTALVAIFFGLALYRLDWKRMVAT